MPVTKRLTGIAICGAESNFTPDVIDTLRRLGLSIDVAIQIGEAEWDFAGVEDLLAQLNDQFDTSVPCVVPWMTPGWRKQRIAEAERLGFRDFPGLIDPTAIVSDTLEVTEASFVNAGAVIGAQCRFGFSVFVNRGASIGHHAQLADYVTIGPGANLASSVVVQTGAFIGAGAAIAPGVKIGSNSVIASGASVHRDIPSNALVAGNPFRVVKTGILGHKGVGV